MAKFYGEVGYAQLVETSPGVWVEQIVPRNYYGDEVKVMSRTRDGEQLNDNFVADTRISIVADPFAYDNFSTMRYVKWMGTKWKISSVEVSRPRLILTIGGVYNEQGPSNKTP